MWREESSDCGQRALGRNSKRDREEIQICKAHILSGHISLMSVEHGIKGEAICPAGGEIEDVDLAVWPCGLAHPAQ